MVASRLLKSWAMPPVSCPMASIFCDWRSCSCALCSASERSSTRRSSVSLSSRTASSARWRSVSSRAIFRKPCGSPDGPVGSMLSEPFMNTRRPSLHRCQRLSGALPCSAAVTSSMASIPAIRSSGVKMSDTWRPIASTASQPKMSCAPPDHSVITPAPSVARIAWSSAFSTTSRRRASRSLASIGCCSTASTTPCASSTGACWMHQWRGSSPPPRPAGRMTS